jgi:phage portal protein BeeE
MSIRERLGQWLSPSPPSDEERLRQAVAALQFPAVHSTYFGPGVTQQPSHETLLQESLGIADVATRAIANRISTLNPQIVTKIGVGADQIEEIQYDHPLKRLLDRPHPDFSRAQLLRLTAQYIVTVGEAYWLKVGNGFGATLELHPIPPTNMWPLIDHGVTTAYRSRDGDGKEQDLPADSVVRFYWPDPQNPWAAEGYLGPVGVVTDALKFSNQHLRYHYQNDATPKTALEASEHAEGFSPEAQARFAELWNRKYNNRSGSISGTPAMLPTGYKLVQMAIMTGADLTPLLDYWRDDQLMAFGTPRSILGQVISGDRSSAETNAFVFDMHTILPIANMMSDTLTLQLASDYEDDILVKFQEFVAKDKDFLLQQEQQDLTLKVRSVNQVREDRNKSGVEWGDLPIGTPQDTPYDGSEPEPIVAPMPASTPEEDEDEAERAMISALRSIFGHQKRFVLKHLKENGTLGFRRQSWSQVFHTRLPTLPVELAQGIDDVTEYRLEEQFNEAYAAGETQSQMATRVRRVFDGRRKDAKNIIQEAR